MESKLKERIIKENKEVVEISKGEKDNKEEKKEEEKRTTKARIRQNADGQMNVKGRK